MSVFSLDSKYQLDVKEGEGGVLNMSTTALILHSENPRSLRSEPLLLALESSNIKKLFYSRVDRSKQSSTFFLRSVAN